MKGGWKTRNVTVAWLETCTASQVGRRAACNEQTIKGTVAAPHYRHSSHLRPRPYYAFALDLSRKQLVPISSSNESSPVKRMSALVFFPTLGENLQARGAHRFPGVLPLQKVLAVQRSHPQPCGFVLDRPQAHNHSLGSGHLERPPQAKYALSNFDFTHSSVAGRQNCPVHAC